MSVPAAEGQVEASRSNFLLEDVLGWHVFLLSKTLRNQLSNEKRHWLFRLYRGWKTTQSYGDYDGPQAINE